MVMVAGGMLCVGAVSLRAEDKPEVPAAAQASDAKPMKQGRLTLPWNQLSSLSDEQKTQIRQIHRKALAEKKKIDQQERADIMALLNDDQKAEVAKYEESRKVSQKMKQSASADKPAEQPSQQQ
jgi:Spy/CpxP family protein refolding chaperone